jgi:hypothetical protein
MFNLFGIGKNQNENNFKQLTSITKGNYYKVENVEDLVSHLQKSYDYLNSLIAYNANIKVKINPV